MSNGDGLLEAVLKYCGKIATLTIYRNVGMKIDVRVLDLKRSYSRIEFLVEPVHGEGSAWVTKKHLSNLRDGDLYPDEKVIQDDPYRDNTGSLRPGSESLPDYNR